MKTKFTKKLLDSLTPQSKPYRVYDTEQPGLLIRIQPSGYMTYMLSWARNCEVALGRVKTITLEQARTMTAKYLAEAHEHGAPLDVTHKQKSSSTPTLRQFLETSYLPWFKVHQPKGYDKTKLALEGSFKSILDKKLTEITTYELETIRTQWITGGNQKSTANRKMGALSGALSRALEWSIIDTSPLAKVKQFSIDSTPNVRYLSTNERARLLEALNAREDRTKAERESANLWRSEREIEPFPDLSQVVFIDHLMPMIRISLNTGVRRGELFNMQWSNMDFDTQIITVPGNGTKNSKTRHIPMNTLVVSTLKSWQEQTGGTGYVFPSKNDERMQDVKTAWGTLLKKAQITSFRWHDLRHDFASQLVMRGVPLNTVRDLLGHSDIKMTLRYAHLAPENTANAVELLT